MSMKAGQKGVYLILPEELYNSFKSKVYSEGKTVKDVLLELIKKYLEEVNE